MAVAPTIGVNEKELDEDGLACVGKAWDTVKEVRLGISVKDVESVLESVAVGVETAETMDEEVDVEGAAEVSWVEVAAAVEDAVDWVSATEEEELCDDENEDEVVLT